MRQQTFKNRRGQFLLLVVFLLGTSFLIASESLRSHYILADRLAQHEKKIQSHWLAQSGLERARSRLAKDPAYVGEDWRLAASKELPRPARVVIRVAVGETKDEKVIVADSLYPDDETVGVRVTLEFPLSPKNLGVGETP